jgi:CBS-domain-containing membrane protein
MLFFVGEAPGTLLRPPSRPFAAVRMARRVAQSAQVICPRRGVIDADECEDCPRLIARTSEASVCLVRGSEPVWPWMTPAGQLAVTSPATSCREAEAAAARAGVRYLLVLDEARALAGIVSRGDLRRDLRGTVGAVMARDVFVTGPATSLAAARAAMEQLGVGCLPIVDDALLLGLITRADLTRAGAPSLS